MATHLIANDEASDVFAGLDTRVDRAAARCGRHPDRYWAVADRSACPRRFAGSLERLFELTGGALALVSGRPIADLDRLFAPLNLPAIGGHGAEMRVREAKSSPVVAAAAAGSAAAFRRCSDAGLRHRRRGQRLFAGAALSQCSAS